MNLEDQVCSLELSQRLKELGVKQNSLFWHRTNVGDGNVKLVHGIGLYGTPDDETCSAFTVAELGEMLPFTIFVKGYPAEYWSYATDEEFNVDENDNKTTLHEPRKYYCAYIRFQPDAMKIEQFDINEANARAKMLIYLLENKLLTLEK